VASLLYVLTRSTDDPDRAATGLHAALAAVRAEHDVALWLTGEGVRLGIRGVAETLHEPLEESAAAMMQALADAQVPLFLDRASFERRSYAEDALRPGAQVVGAAHLASLVADGRHAVTL
jgi:predicted peroxiredoxin